MAVLVRGGSSGVRGRVGLGDINRPAREVEAGEGRGEIWDIGRQE